MSILVTFISLICTESTNSQDFYRKKNTKESQKKVHDMLVGGGAPPDICHWLIY